MATNNTPPPNNQTPPPAQPNAAQSSEQVMSARAITDTVAQRSKLIETRELFADMLGIERSRQDILRSNIKDLQRQIDTIGKQNAKLETLNRTTINIKDIEKSMIDLDAQRFLGKMKITEFEQKHGKEAIDGYKNEMEALEKSRAKAKEKYDEHGKSLRDVEKKQSELGSTYGQGFEKRAEEMKAAQERTAVEKKKLDEEEAKRNDVTKKIADEKKAYEYKMGLAKKGLGGLDPKTEEGKKAIAQMQTEHGLKMKLLREEGKAADQNFKDQKGKLEQAQTYEKLGKIENMKAIEANMMADEEGKKKLQAMDETERKRFLQHTSNKMIGDKQELDLMNKKSAEAGAASDAARAEYQAKQDLTSEGALEYMQMQKEGEAIDSQNEAMQKKLAFEKRVNDNLGVMGKLTSLVADKLGVGVEVSAAMAKKARELQEEEEILGIKRSAATKKLLVAWEGIKAGAKELYKMATDPVALIAGGVALAYSAVSKGFGMMKDAFTGAGEKLRGLSEDTGHFAADLTGGISNFAKQIPVVGFLLGGLIDMFAAAIDMTLGVNDAMVKLGRTIGMSAQESTAMSAQFARANITGGDLYMTTKKYMESLVEINQELGVTLQLSNATLSANTRLKDMAGVDAATRAKLVALGEKQKIGMAGVTKEILGQVAYLKQSTGIALNYQQTLQEVTNLSGVLGLEFSKHPGKITAAYVQTKALGMELSKVEGMASQFLDFQSSISKEFEAQLLTGKDINLQKVRELMLNNKIGEAAEEISRQIGSSEDFLNMNRLAQESFADAMGTSRDELANMLKEQEQMAAFGAKSTKELREQVMLMKQRGEQAEAIAKLGGEEAYNAIVSASAQEKIAMIIEKIKSSIVDLVVNSGILDKVQEMIAWFENPQNMTSLLFKVRDVFASIAEIMLEIAGGIMKVINWLGFIDDRQISKFEHTKSMFMTNIRNFGSEQIAASGQMTQEQMSLGMASSQEDLAKRREMSAMSQPAAGNLSQQSETEVSKKTGIPAKETGGLVKDQTNLVGQGEYVMNRTLTNMLMTAANREQSVTPTTNNQPAPVPPSKSSYTIYLTLPDGKVIAQTAKDGLQIVGNPETSLNYSLHMA